jgi:hypothetical protein
MGRAKPPVKSSETRIRCAIYTRKSTEDGLDQEFNSLDAQREAAEAYIASQKHEGWVCVPTLYDDGGFSGGNVERPGLQRMLADINDGKIDCVVVYKVDRLSRSLMDLTFSCPSHSSNGRSLGNASATSWLPNVAKESGPAGFPFWGMMWIGRIPVRSWS